MRGRTFLAFAGVAGLLVLGLWTYRPERAEAACGASVSSCKSCHEVQGKKPVNKIGQWHVQHSFGDFCEFCHAGVTKEQTKEGAHQGMRQPLADVQQSCGSCHAADLAARSAKYGGTAVGVSAPSGSSSTGSSAPASTPAVTPAAPAGASASSAPPPAAKSTAPAPAAGSKDLIDYNKELGAGDEGIGKGNVILIFLNLAAAVALGGSWWYFEKGPGRSGVLGTKRIEVAAPAGVDPILYELLTGCDKSTLAALKAILDRGEQGCQLLKVASQLDVELMNRLRGMTKEELNLLHSLARRL